MIAAKPNTPIATVVKPRPSGQFGNVERHTRGAGFDVGADHRQQDAYAIMAIAFSTEPLASTTAKIRPSTIRKKYSAGPNASAS